MTKGLQRSKKSLHKKHKLHKELFIEHTNFTRNWTKRHCKDVHETNYRGYVRGRIGDTHPEKKVCTVDSAGST